VSEALVYFEDVNGNILIPMVVEAKTPPGYHRHEVHSAHAIEEVSRRYAAQKQAMFNRLDEETAYKLEVKMAEVRGSLTNRMAYTKSQFEKDFIRYTLKRMEEDEHKVRERRYEMHLEMEAKEAPLSRSNVTKPLMESDQPHEREGTVVANDSGAVRPSADNNGVEEIK
jgi:hypothetical protein